MKTTRVLTVCVGSLLAGVLLAQSHTATPAARATYPERSFALVVNDSMNFAQSHSGFSAPLFRYVHQHPNGTYVVFTQEGAVYRIDNPARLKEIRDLYAPMAGLQAQGEALAHAQRPLAQKQKALASQQEAATDPADKGRIGQVQGAIGEEQGTLGSAQGELGRQQGEIARAAFGRMQEIFASCLADGSCPRVTS